MLEYHAFVDMSNQPPPGLDKNVSKHWKPVEALDRRPRGMVWSDRIWYWFVSLGGLALIAAGICVFYFLHLSKIGSVMIGCGLVTFAMGPSHAARNGYRSD
jgi:hypothetical protein